MGRKRATFREGIGPAERQYAQALRDIRDLRGETQQEFDPKWRAQLRAGTVVAPGVAAIDLGLRLARSVIASR
jgi:hypothetical protein